MNNSANSKFQKGTGVYECECCGRRTRHTGIEPDGAKICADCYELAGLYNLMIDDGPEALTAYAQEIRDRCANITAKGGTLDGDAGELLAAVGQ